MYKFSITGPVTLAELDVNAFERLLGSCMSVMRRDVERYKVNNKTEHVRTHINMSEHVRTRQKTLKRVKACHDMLKLIRSCLNISKQVRIRQKLIRTWNNLSDHGVMEIEGADFLENIN